eukprot:m.204603 g.204603  ORF g.204603 m.204603 type:complete len:247 (-) comp22585_c0_seq1:133-873(-)
MATDTTNVGVIVGGVVAVAAVVTAAWPTIAEASASAIETVTTTLNELPEDQAMLVLMAAAAVLTVLMQPITPLNLMAGALFGLWGGTLVFTLGATLGTVGCYVIGKTLVSAWAQRQLDASPTLRKISVAVRTDGLRMIVLARLSPLAPFAVLSYVLGATGVGLFDYVVGTFVGLLPGVLLYCWIGINAAEAAKTAAGADGEDGGDDNTYLTLGFSIGASVVASALAKRALDSATAQVAADAKVSND